MSISTFNPKTLKAIVFDVDDTLTRGTLETKINTFKEMFANQATRLEEGRARYEYTGKGDRYNIIAHVLDEPQEGCQSNPRVVALAKRFEKVTMERIRKQGIHDNDIEALTILKEKFSGPICLLSATPQTSVEGNVAHFEKVYPAISGMFYAIKGTPMENGKGGELKLFAERHRVLPGEVVMIGDGNSDYNGALDAGTQFIGVIPEGKNDKWPEYSFPKLMAIAELPNLLGL